MTRAPVCHALIFIILSIAIGCDSGQSGYGSKKSGKAADAPLAAPATSAMTLLVMAHPLIIFHPRSRSGGGGQGVGNGGPGRAK